MTTRQELRAMIDSVADDDIEAVARSLQSFIEPTARPGRPAFIGMGHSGHRDTSERTEEILRETGFGE